jgi:excisionase family DNA binding protein
MSEMPLSTGQAALIAGRHQRTIVAWIRRGELRAQKMPGKRGPYLIRKEDLLELIKIKYTPKPYHPQGGTDGQATSA